MASRSAQTLTVHSRDSNPPATPKYPKTPAKTKKGAPKFKRVELDWLSSSTGTDVLASDLSLASIAGDDTADTTSTATTDSTAEDAWLDAGGSLQRRKFPALKSSHPHSRSKTHPSRQNNAAKTREKLSHIGKALAEESGLRSRYPDVDWSAKAFNLASRKKYGYSWINTPQSKLSWAKTLALQKFHEKGLGSQKSGLSEIILSLLAKEKIGLCFEGRVYVYEGGKRWDKEAEAVRDSLREVIGGLCEMSVETADSDMRDENRDDVWGPVDCSS